MVRAPPCHGGSCGFEPRLPRTLCALLLAILLFVSCSKSSLSDFQKEGRTILIELTAELKQIRSRDDLPAHAVRLQQLFDRLAEVMIAAQEYKSTHPDIKLAEDDDDVHLLSDRLRTEFNRILRMEGGTEIIEKAQENALNKLDAFESSLVP